MKKVLEIAHQILAENVTKQDVCIDMTVGNGNDTLFLANIAKHVYGFDIQKEAITKTKEKLKTQKIDNVTLYLDNHAHLSFYQLDKVKGIIFNLGYLPGKDKTITTQVESTLIALKQSLECLVQGGICVCVIYPGHEEGFKESQQIQQYVKHLNQKEYEVLQYAFINQIHEPPYLIAIKKLKEKENGNHDSCNIK